MTDDEAATEAAEPHGARSGKAAKLHDVLCLSGAIYQPLRRHRTYLHKDVCSTHPPAEADHLQVHSHI